MKDKEFDNFLREKLNELSAANTGGFAAFEQHTQAAKRKKAALILAALLFLFGGFFILNQWVNNQQNIAQPEIAVPKLPANTNIDAVDAQIKADEPTANTSNPNVAIQQEKAPLTSSSLNSNKSVPASKKYAKNGLETAVLTQKDANQQTNIYADVVEINHAQNSIVAPEHSEQTTTNTQVYVANNTVDIFDETPTQPEPTAYQNDVRETDKWSVTASVYPNFTFRELSINNAKATQVHQDYMDVINASERGGIAFNAGVDVRYHLGNNLFIGSGLAYIQTKITGNYAFDITNSPIIDGNGNITGYTALGEPITIDRGIIQTYQYVQLPLHISYQPWVADRVRLTIEGGISYIRLINASGTTIDH